MFQCSLIWFVGAAIIMGQWHACIGVPITAELDRMMCPVLPGSSTKCEYDDGDAGTAPRLPYQSLAALLTCFSLHNAMDTLESYMTAGLLKGGSLANIQLINYFDIIHQGIPDALKGGLEGNGQYLCDQYTANATVGKYNCLLNGEQSFLDNELANGYQTILCDDMSDNYVQFLDGYMKMYMTNSLTAPVGGYIDFGGCLGYGRCVFFWNGIYIKLPCMSGLFLNFEKPLPPIIDPAGT